MKKNFFKKLASVLSLALVVTSVAPMTSTTAAAASTPDLSKRYVTVYEGSSDSYTVKNATGYTVKWSVSGTGAKYASLTKTSGTSTKLSVDTNGATAAKNAAVVVKATFYKNGKKVVAKSDSVTIKVNATAVAISTKADVKAIPAGVAVDFNKTLTPANSTSKVVWSVTTATGAATTLATVDQTNGYVTATVAGTYKVTVDVKSATDKVLATASQDITVVNNVDKVSQKSLTKINVVFTNVVKDLVKASDFSVVNTSTKVKQVVKSISFSDDGKTVIVSLYSNLVSTKDYEVTYGTQTKTFTANAGAVTQVVLTAANITYATPTALGIQLLDANGVDVTTSTDLAKVTYATTKGYVNATDGTLVLYSVGDKATVTATYHTYTYVDSKEVTYTATADYVAVDTATTAIKSLTAYTVATTTPASFSTVSHVVSLSDTGSSLKKLFVTGVNTSGTTVTSGYTYESTDSSTLIVASNGTLLPVKVGSVAVKVLYNSVTVDTVVITVGAARAATTITADKATVTLSNGASAADSAKVTLTVLDQYGVAFDATGASFTAVGVTNASVSAIATGNAVTFTCAPSTTAGTYQYTLKDEGLLISVSVIIKDAATDVKSYALTLSDTTLDAVYAESASSKAIDIKLFSYDTNGVKVKQVTGTGVTFEITRAGDSTYAKTLYTSQSATTFDVLTVGGTSPTFVVTAAAADIYTVKAVSGTAVLYVTTFTVKDTQTAPTFTTLSANAMTTSNTSLGAISVATTGVADLTDLVTVSDGTVVSVTAATTGTGIFTTSGTVYNVVIQSALIRVTLDTGVYRYYTVAVNQYAAVTYQ